MNAPHEPAVAAAVQNAEKTLAIVAGAYLDAYAGRDESRYQRMTAWIRLLGDKPFTAITPEDVEVAMRQLAAEPAKVFAGKDADGNQIFRKKDNGQRSGGTLNRYLQALAALFSWARRYVKEDGTRYVSRTHESPTRTVEKHKEKKGRVRFLSDKERERLLAASRESPWPRLFLLVLLAMTTGARRGELLALRWCDIDLDAGEARIGEDAEQFETKNGDARTLILLPQVLEELAKFKPRDATTSAALVFRSRLRPSQPYATAQAFNDALDEAGIKNFRFHDLRHTAASYMAQSGASLLEIADTLGHRQLRMVQRYAHLNTSSRRNLMNRVFEGRL
jgi:integrase